jgi:hypothetical protein
MQAGSTPARTDTLAELRQQLVDRFSEEELRAVCFDLGIDYESLPAQGKAGKARELVALCERNDNTDKLVAKCSKMRPNVSWQGKQPTTGAADVLQLDKELAEEEPTPLPGVELILFARGKWGGDFNTLGAALSHFSKRHQRKTFGPHTFTFEVRPNANFGELLMRCWMVAYRSYNRETLFIRKDDAGRLWPEGGWPYAEVRAREVPGGLKVELFHTDQHLETIRSYLGRLRDALIEDGLEPTATGAPDAPTMPTRGVTINAQTVNIGGDVVGRDKTQEPPSSK